MSTEAAPATDPTIIDPAAPKPDAAPEALSFEAFMEDALSKVEVSPDPKKKDEDTESKPSGDFTIPDAATRRAAGDPDPAPAEAADKALDDIFRTKPGAAFSQLKGEVKAHRAEVENLRRQLEEAKTNAGPDPDGERAKAELAEAKQALAEYEQELTIVKVEATRDYKETVQKPLNAVKATVADLAKRYSVNEGALLAALEEKDGAAQDTQLTDLAASFSERDRMKLYGMTDTYAKIVEADQFVRSNAAIALKTIEERRARESASAAEARTGDYARGLDETKDALAKDFPFFRPVEGDAAWNDTLSKLDAAARATNVGDLAPREQAKLAYHGAAVPLLAKAVGFYATELTKARAEIAALTKSTPGAGAGGGGPGNPAPKVAEGVGFMDAIEEGLSGRR